jgi:hypothetical protein
LNDCTIAGNSAGADGGGIANNGGGVTPNQCSVMDNTANHRGGRIRFR